jgi:hypothetical protein
VSRRFLVPLLLGALLAPVLGAAPARATTFLETSVEETTRGADAVVRGKVLRTAARWIGGRIVTEAEIAVASAWKGAPGERITVAVPGGRVGDLAQRVSGSPTFRPEEEVVVFATRAGPGRWGVAGLAQGKYRVEAGQARPDLSGVRFETRPLAQGERPVSAMPVEELERRVRATR